MSRILGFVLSILFVISCNEITNPTLERIEDVEIVEASIRKLEINVNAILNNPNSFALDLASADLSVMVDDIELAHILQTIDAEMPANSEFKMPLNVKMELTRLYGDDPLNSVKKGMKILKEKQLLIQVQGDIKVGRGGAKISVPVDQEQIVEF